MGPTHSGDKHLISHISAVASCSIGQSGKLAGYLIVSAFAELTKSLGGWSLVANALLLGSPWGWIAIDNIRRMNS